MSEERKQFIEYHIERNINDINEWIESIAFNVKWNIDNSAAERGLGDSFKWAIDWIWSLRYE